jgi:alkylation response protein AidB-like acyl-CoA dehydrogenase
MDLSFTTEEHAFREEVRSFLKTSLPTELAAKGAAATELTKSDMQQWHALLNAQGWLAVTWPAAYGGTGWTAVQRHIFEEECAMANAPRIVPFGLNMLGPVVIKFGSEAQKAEILPRILNGTDWWCQGYSEPGAGSDLASLKTRAERDGDEYVINGQKAWTTLGQYADRIFCLVRTKADGKPQAGISFVLVDLDTPGIEMRPIKLLEGGVEVNEVFFTDVRVPVSNLVGEENQGWTIAKYLLTHERTNIAGVGFATRDMAKLKTLTTQVKRNGQLLSQDVLFMAQVVELEADLEAMRITNLRMLQNANEGAAPGPEASMLKIKGTVIRQKISALYRTALGPHAAAMPSDAVEHDGLPVDAITAAATYFNNRKLSIYGGSNEIQRNIIANDILKG